MTDKLRKLGKDKRDEVLSGKKTSGFTIIEVALVLAIAALIFLVVFLAVPALQRNQRNDAITRDISNVVAAYTSYVANNPTGSIGAETAYSTGTDGTVTRGAKLGKFIDTLSSNISKVSVLADPTSSGSSAVNFTETDIPLNTIIVYPGSKCNPASPNASVVDAGARQAAVVAQIEANQSTIVFKCQDAS